MAKYIGRLAKVGVGKESSRGAGASATYQVPKLSFSFDDKAVKARSDAGLGVLADSEEAFVTTRFGGGEIEAEIRDKSFGLFLYNLLGSLSTAGPTDSAYTHSFSVSNTNNHQSLALLVEDSNTTELYKLVMLDSLELTAELDRVVRFTASFVSKKGNTSALTVPALVAENKFTKKHLSFKVASNLAGLSGATASTLKSLKLTISKNVLLDDGLGTAEPEDILNRQLSVEGEIELNYTDETWKAYMTDGSSKAVEIKFVNTDATIGAGATNPSLTIQLPKVDFFDWEPNYANDEIVRQKISFKASHDISGGNAIISTCALVNGVTSY